MFRTTRSERWALAVLAILFVVGCSTVPVTGRKTFNLIPESQAIALGADAYQQALSGERLIRTGPDYEMVNRAGRRIAAISGRDDYDWEFSLIDDDQTVNAFALPGGKVAVYTGILPVAQGEAGLATVMSHEVAHAIAQHGSERMTDQLALQLGGMGLEALLGQKSEATRSLVLAAYGVGAQVGVLLPFGRAQESEADHIGLVFMARAGYDPRAAVDFWERMGQLGGGARPPEFLSTHPNPETRVRDLQGWMPEALAEYQKTK
ncbi:MAG: M48 family metallopeptidase [Candidatus Eisenbacteria bacterium]|uniref:M48 family metallopeptidase n=1 Tax=Eiseniibacteriota bacterium TaxID=2212470 RepID=A0A956NAL9_UNCEI|nr:M48 family metallopeptidase [Candidatus Eisenbacteria bacterium]MCB9465196.1 M48 family metallopeptidase [Candidatus Eisenbacteria bacterium]